jgi:hypothetical protein
LCAVTAYGIPTLRPCKETSWTTWRFSKHPCLLLWLFTFTFSVNHASSKKNTSSRLRNLLAIDCWNQLQYQLRAFQSRGGRCKGLILCGRSSTISHYVIFVICSSISYVILWAEAFYTPHNRDSVLLGLVSIPATVFPRKSRVPYNENRFPWDNSIKIQQIIIIIIITITSTSFLFSFENQSFIRSNISKFL